MEAAAHSNLTGIAVVALAALLCGLGLERLRQPAIVGYILAGVLLGPSAFAVVHDRGDIDVLAELGVLMLLFVIGMELSLRAFRRVWKLAVLTT
ncbi:MAG: cation/H(+) antiporter, partial [Rhodospirillales bacterium]|nr:cation/H(+) antiporter [Rhodospirillales bacterium]